jgi:hypothetical protein
MLCIHLFLVQPTTLHQRLQSIRPKFGSGLWSR